MPLDEHRAPPGELGWLISGFTHRLAGVSHAVVVSSDGVLVAASELFPRERAEQLAALTSGLVGVTMGAARLLDSVEVRQTVVEMGRGYLLVMTIRDGSILAVLATREADLGIVGYEMVRLVHQAGERLTPALRAAGQN